MSVCARAHGREWIRITIQSYRIFRLFGENEMESAYWIEIKNNYAFARRGAGRGSQRTLFIHWVRKLTLFVSIMNINFIIFRFSGMHKCNRAISCRYIWFFDTHARETISCLSLRSNIRTISFRLQSESSMSSHSS